MSEGGINVYGLDEWTADELPDWIPPDADLVLRCRSHSEPLIPSYYQIEHSYDELLDQPLQPGTAQRIAADLVERARDREIWYIVPPPAGIADATVALLEHRTSVYPHFPDSLPVVQASGDVQLVDALALAEAELEWPFDAGLAPIDPSAPTIVTKWFGRGVIELAERRLRRTHRLTDLLMTLAPPDEEGVFLIVPFAVTDGGPSLSALRQIYARLRRPDGCPWDREQTELSTLPHIVEETDELREALEREDWPHAAEELGDILGNVLMIAQIAEEQGRFTFEDVVIAISSKLVRRHPHVFGDASASNPDEVLAIWNTVKQQEREQAARVAGGEDQGDG